VFSVAAGSRFMAHPRSRPDRLEVERGEHFVADLGLRCGGAILVVARATNRMMVAIERGTERLKPG